ncbi:hypothetical protein PTD2_00342 [Pseudoalteromonas tunicata D2]|uniref:Uncharacterized protein n=1 Tax=Pseudoalteromonas tunicata D2 TaxID=87626 RepID=A4CF63_9GAMM|nr:hypothetical protein PTD2_00342 [Pseudoalteromonas tunicata D2]
MFILCNHLSNLLIKTLQYDAMYHRHEPFEHDKTAYIFVVTDHFIQALFASFDILDTLA